MTLAVFASGGGSNFRAILDAIEAGRLEARVAVLVTDRPGAGAIDRGRTAGIDVAVVPPAKEPVFAAALLEELQSRNVTHVALAGYLRRVPPEVVEAFRHRIVNVHPSLLPAFGGGGMYGRRVHEAVLESGVRWTGATVHFVDDNYDTGPIILQDVVPVDPDDTPASLAARVLEVEHRIYPQALQLLASGRLAVDGRRVRITDSDQPPTVSS